MWTYIARRLLLALPLLLLVSVIVFSLIHLVPGDPADAILGPEAPREAKEAFRQRLGLHLPLHVQFARWLGGVARGDLGRSLVDGRPVAELLSQRLPATLELTVLTFAVTVVVAVPLGILAAAHRATPVDVLSSALALAGLSVPHFWLGLLLILLFAVHLGWLPASGYVPLWDDPVANLRTMLLPALATGMREAGTIARFVRSSVLEVLHSEFVRTARAKGLPERTVLYRHALRNALIPVVTASGLQVAGLLGGLVITETIFGIPGLGRLIVDAIFMRDITVVQGAVLVAALLVIAVNLAVDVLYSVIDPRIQVQGQGGRP